MLCKNGATFFIVFLMLETNLVRSFYVLPLMEMRTETQFQLSQATYPVFFVVFISNDESSMDFLVDCHFGLTLKERYLTKWWTILAVVDCSKTSDICEKHNIEKYPTMKVIRVKSKRVLDTLVGHVTPENITRLFDKYLVERNPYDDDSLEIAGSGDSDLAGSGNGDPFDTDDVSTGDIYNSITPKDFTSELDFGPTTSSTFVESSTSEFSFEIEESDSGENSTEYDESSSSARVHGVAGLISFLSLLYYVL